MVGGLNIFHQNTAVAVVVFAFRVHVFFDVYDVESGFFQCFDAPHVIGFHDGE